MISFVILTIGDKPDKLRLCIKSIHKNFEGRNDYEICVVGNNIPNLSSLNVKTVEDKEKKEFLGARKNIGTDNTSGEILVHCDDDIVFSKNWLNTFENYGKRNKDWQIMGNKVLLPDGTRYWDRAIFFPAHKMVDYDFYSDDVTFYQSGAFSISKRSLLDKIRWDDNIPFYGMFNGFKHNEDVEFSIRLKDQGVKIFFDKNNVVWHNDSTYASDNVTCNKKKQQSDVNHKCMDFILATN